jgi:hypothetical protein
MPPGSNNDEQNYQTENARKRQSVMDRNQNENPASAMVLHHRNGHGFGVVIFAIPMMATSMSTAKAATMRNTASRPAVIKSQ